MSHGSAGITDRAKQPRLHANYTLLTIKTDRLALLIMISLSVSTLRSSVHSRTPHEQNVIHESASHRRFRLYVCFEYLLARKISAC